MSFFDEELEDDLDESARGPSDVSRIRDVLLSAVMALATDGRDMRIKLRSVMPYVVALTEQHFPADLRADFLKLRAAFPTEQAMADWLKTLSADRAEGLIRRIIFLSDAVSQSHGRASYRASRLRPWSW